MKRATHILKLSAVLILALALSLNLSSCGLAALAVLSQFIPSDFEINWEDIELPELPDLSDPLGDSEDLTDPDMEINTAPPMDGEQMDAVEGVTKALPSVVVIEAKTAEGDGTGTGIVLSEDGYIATNHHVIEDATRIRVTFYDGQTASAKIVGSSEMDDLAVIKVELTGLTPATFAHSDDCYVGETVYAIGTPAGPDFAWTTTRGIISYVNREVKIYDDMDGTLLKKLRLLQTDANVNPGNSGGPLINEDGNVVGVVSMKLAEGYEGIGFAIPSDGAVEILEAIIRDGNADSINSSISHKRPVLGITGVYLEKDSYYVRTETGVQLITEDERDQYSSDEVIFAEASGIYVVSVSPGTGSERNLFVGDIITEVEGSEIFSMNDLMNALNDHYAGDTVTLSVYRGGSTQSVSITLTAQADN